MRDAVLSDGSSQMRAIGAMIENIADTDATVLIRGESGVGKDLVARAIHAGSSRRHAPLVKVNCAAIPSELLESEFFGHEKGAFTGAHRRKPGQFERAHKGTIYLDEIGELPLALQAKLLNVLQDFRFSRVGGNGSIDVGSRVIQQHPWSGNVRELENVVRRLVVLTDVAGEIEALAARGRNGHGLVRPPAEGLREIARRAAREAERKALEDVLHRVHWNRAAASRILQVSYKTPLHKIVDCRLTPPLGRQSANPWTGGPSR